MHENMKCSHHNLEFELHDEWLVEAGLESFSATEVSYNPDTMKANGHEIIIIPIDEIAPMKERAECRGVFCDNEKDTAKERVVRILKWFKENKNIEPISVAAYAENMKLNIRFWRAAIDFIVQLQWVL